MARPRRSLLTGLLLRAFPQALLLLAVGAAVGFALNARRADPLPVNLPGFLLLTESGAQVVFPMRARELFDQGLHVFVDARREDAYIEQHIEGAFSLPIARFDELAPELRLWTAGQPILVYGSERDFVSADDLARRLIASGEKEVLLLAPGFEAWAARGLPLESGDGGILGEASGAGGAGAPAGGGSLDSW
jgi:rhodanese-related sulfurtransferase